MLELPKNQSFVKNIQAIENIIFASILLFSPVLVVHIEGDGAINSLRAAAFCKRQQEVHHLPYLSQLCYPLTKFSRVGLVALNRCVWGIVRRSPEDPGGLQQLPCHQVGEVRRPELWDGRDGEASWLGQVHRPVWKLERLFREIQVVDGLVGPQKTLAFLPLLAALLQRLNPQAHRLRQLSVQPEGQLNLLRHVRAVHSSQEVRTNRRQLCGSASRLRFCPLTPNLCFCRLAQSVRVHVWEALRAEGGSYKELQMRQEKTRSNYFSKQSSVPAHRELCLVLFVTLCVWLCARLPNLNCNTWYMKFHQETFSLVGFEQKKKIVALKHFYRVQGKSGWSWFPGHLQVNRWLEFSCCNTRPRWKLK